MKLTVAEVEALVRPGDYGIVHYYRPDFVQAEIAAASGGPWMHAFGCLGGLDIVEAEVVGTVASSLRNYLRGNCRVVIRRPKPALSLDEQRTVVQALLDSVGEGYDFGMIAGMAALFGLRRVLHPFAPRLANWCLKHLRNAFADPDRATCAELVAVAQRRARPGMLRGWPGGNVYPEILSRCPDTHEVADWHAPVLAG